MLYVNSLNYVNSLQQNHYHSFPSCIIIGWSWFILRCKTLLKPDPKLFSNQMDETSCEKIKLTDFAVGIHQEIKLGNKYNCALISAIQKVPDASFLDVCRRQRKNKTQRRKINIRAITSKWLISLFNAAL